MFYVSIKSNATMRLFLDGFHT